MLFEEQISRKPNLYPWTDEFIDTMWNGFWTPNLFNFKADYNQFKTDITDEERQIIVRTLSAIGQVEIAVKTFWAKLGENLPHPSISDLGFVLANTEVVHNNAYEKLLEVLGLEDAFQDNLKEPVVAGRINYLKKYNKKVYANHRQQYVYSIILFTLFMENVSLFSQFYIILWFNRFQTLFKDTAQQVMYTRLEESIHAQVGIKLVNTLRQEYPELFDDSLTQKIKEEVQVAIKHESNLIDWIIGDYQAENISADILKNYIKIRLNDSLKAIGYDAEFEIDQALAEKAYWMDEDLLGEVKVDFFHKRPVAYQKHNRQYDVEDLF